MITELVHHSRKLNKALAHQAITKNFLNEYGEKVMELI